MAEKKTAGRERLAGKETVESRSNERKWERSKTEKEEAKKMREATNGGK